MQKASDIAELDVHCDSDVGSDPDADVVMYSDPITDVRDDLNIAMSLCMHLQQTQGSENEVEAFENEVGIKLFEGSDHC